MKYLIDEADDVGKGANATISFLHYYLQTHGRVYFRISLKRGQTHCGKFQEGANPNPKGGNPILNIGKANCQVGGSLAEPDPHQGERVW